jgi:hypothetical protein
MGLFAHSINDAVRRFDQFTEILPRLFWYVSAYQRKLFDCIDGGEDLFDY